MIECPFVSASPSAAAESSSSSSCKHTYRLSTTEDASNWMSSASGLTKPSAKGCTAHGMCPEFLHVVLTSIFELISESIHGCHLAILKTCNDELVGHVGNAIIAALATVALYSQ
eukprot:1921780-Amphidinium_carterae.1